ncbi:MAG: hypothetical protein COB79_01880 [Zetaproteobacteria bacterium]|nr:MAG: hypothetical protein COB79_01880 [Zetaproteobacteria bacterium]
MRKYLATKVGALLGVLFLLVLIFGWDLLQDMKYLQQEAAIVEESNHQSHDLHAIEMGVYANIKIVSDFLITGDHRLLDKFEAHHQRLIGIIEQYGVLHQDSSLSDLLMRVQRIKAIANKVFHLPFATENMEGPIFIDEIARETKQAVVYLSKKHHVLDAQVNSAMQMMEGLRIDMRQETIALVWVLLLAMGFLTYFIYNNIVLPLVHMKQEVQRVGQGYFDVNCHVSSNDEIGELARTFNTMGEALGEREQKLNRLRSLAAHQEKMNAMGVMSASIAHEVGNPLASINMLLQVAKRKLRKHDDQAVAAHLDSALQETERMESIIQMILQFGRYEEGSHFQVFDVQPIIKDAVRLAQMSPQHKRVPIHIDIDTKLPLIYASDSMLMQVLMNLIYNACHACKSGGEVAIRVFKQQQVVVIDVCDTGHGIAETIRESIFQPHVTTKEKDEGSGFGLAISKELMDAMHGTLTLLEDTKQGTCFQISVPTSQGKDNL